MKRMPLVILVLGLLISASTAQAGRHYRVDLGGNSWTVQAFTTSKTLHDFYGYDADGSLDDDGSVTWDERFLGDPTVIDNQDLAHAASHLFLVESSADDQVGLFVVHGRFDQSKSGSMSYAEMLFTTTSDTSLTIEATDDYDGQFQDEYFDALFAGSDVVAAQWGWANGRTDGLAIGWTPEVGDSLTASFANVDGQTHDPSPAPKTYDTSFDGMWQLFSADNLDSTNDPTPTLMSGSIDNGLSATITLVPLPPTAWPVVGMLGALAIRRRFSKHISRKDCE
jgi:hypothetical protein